MRKMSKKSLLLIAMALLFSVIIAGCASEPDDDASKDDKDSGETADKGEGGEEGGELIIAASADAVSLDPGGSNDVLSSNTQKNIYESLTKQDENMEVQPSLATGWEAVEDNVWEFKLREGVKFHDGTDFNAEVVKANIERIIDDEVASPRKFLYEMITDIEVVDDYTVRLDRKSVV